VAEYTRLEPSIVKTRSRLRSRSLYVVVRPSVVSCLSVTSVHTTQAIEIYIHLYSPTGRTK